MPSHSAKAGRDPDRGAHHDANPGILVLDRAGAREVDARALARHGMPTIVLMENAARAVAEEAASLAVDADRPRVLLVCGPGNNGGDGLAAARHLCNAGADVAVLLTAEPRASAADAALNLRIARSMGVPVIVCSNDPLESADLALRTLGGVDVIVDALFGTGLDRPVREPCASLLGWINRQRDGAVSVLAVDIPSGLDCDSGLPLGAAVRADVTVTFAALKRGFLELEAQEYLGDIVIADLGVPRALVEEIATALDVHHPGANESDQVEPPAASHKPGDSAT